MKTPEQLKGAIRNIAKEKNLHAQEVLQIFLFEHILERLSLSPYKDNFVLKGGLLISSMIGISERTTMDMDTTVRGIKDAEIGSDAHKYIGFHAPGQQRWIRGREKSLGTDFTKERIRERIEEKARIRAERMKKLTGRPSSMIDTSGERFADNTGLKRWAEKQNLKTAARIQSKLAESGLDSFDALESKIQSLHTRAKTGKKATVSMDKKLTKFADLLHYARVYSDNGKYIKGYEKSKDPDRYYRTHGDAIEMATAAVHRLKNAGLDPNRIDLQQMELDYRKMTTEREQMSAAYKSAEKECEKLKKLQDDLTSYMGSEHAQEIERDMKRTL